jgi:metallo-beta-lactamase family protein
MSAHGDYRELLTWLSGFKNKPKRVFITHGEPASADSFRKKVDRRFGWRAEVPEYKEVVRLQ